MATTASSDYIPGVCNINPTETAYRRKAGWTGLGLTVMIALPLFLLDANRFTRLILFVPAFLSAVSFLQAKHRFCVAYAAGGMQNASGDKMTTARRVPAADHLKNKAKANAIYLQAGGIALLLAVAVLLLP